MFKLPTPEQTKKFHEAVVVMNEKNGAPMTFEEVLKRIREKYGYVSQSDYIHYTDLSKFIRFLEATNIVAKKMVRNGAGSKPHLQFNFARHITDADIMAHKATLHKRGRFLRLRRARKEKRANMKKQSTKVTIKAPKTPVSAEAMLEKFMLPLAKEMKTALKLQILMEMRDSLNQQIMKLGGKACV